MENIVYPANRMVVMSNRVLINGSIAITLILGVAVAIMINDLSDTQRSSFPQEAHTKSQAEFAKALWMAEEGALLVAIDEEDLPRFSEKTVVYRVINNYPEEMVLVVESMFGEEFRGEYEELAEKLQIDIVVSRESAHYRSWAGHYAYHGWAPSTEDR